MGIFDFLHVDNIKAELENAKLSLSEKTKEISSLQSELKLLEQRFYSRNSKLNDAEKYCNSLLEEISCLNNKNNELSSESSSLSQKYSSLKNNSKATTNILVQLQQEHTDLIEKLTSLRGEYYKVREECYHAKEELTYHKKHLNEILESNLSAFPFLAGMISDYLTFDLEILARKLDWGHSVERAKKVASIREIRADAKQKIDEARVSTYQLEYLKTLFPAIDDILETDYKDLNLAETKITEYDPVRNYISKEEWKTLSESEKNQKALDRYIESRKKQAGKLDGIMNCM